MEQARQIGNAIHKIAFYIFTGQGIDTKSLHPVLVEPAKQVMLWADKYKPEVILCEKPLASTKYGYAGMLDLFAKLKGHKRPCLIDVKSGLSLLVACQVASYENLVHENQYKGMIDKFVLRIPKDGSPYEFQELKEKTAFTFFLNKLYEHNYLRSRK